MLINVPSSISRTDAKIDQGTAILQRLWGSKKSNYYDFIFYKKNILRIFFFHWNKCTTNSTLNGWWKLWKHWIAQPAKGRKTQFHCKKKNQSSPSSSSSNFTSPKCTLVLNTALQNFSVYKTTYINQGEKKDGTTKKKKSTKEECTFPIETNVRVPSIYISLCTIVGYLIIHLKYQISHHSTI